VPDTAQRGDMSYPRIWDREKERRIIGETKVSWLVLNVDWEVRDLEERLKDKWFLDHSITRVNKKRPNKGCSNKWPQWFLSPEEREAYLFVSNNQRKIGRFVECAELTAAQLREIANIAGMEIEKL